MLYRRGIVGWLYKQQIYQYAPEYQHFEDYHRKELWSKEEIKKCTEMKDTVLDGPDYEKKIEEYRKYSNGKRRYIRKISKTSLSCSGPPDQKYAYFETKSGQQRRLKKKREMQLKQKRWLYGQSYKYINILRRFNCLCCKQLRECEMMTHKEIVAFKKQLKKYNPRPRKKVVDEIQPGVAGEITVTESGQEAYHLITTRYGYTVRTKKPKRKSK
ncbi:MAG: hypothetical protein EZS28_005939 [Streblomastix strix]|uniref:Uncharacterized protein n=1 Tax=Streblomastix strix TaxID=222440 RepID=A0A5J4WU99_9EUKA|nr:MAG: hypothetical protein EZS28_005939 [Streblomastix strix]